MVFGYTTGNTNYATNTSTCTLNGTDLTATVDNTSAYYKYPFYKGYIFNAVVGDIIAASFISKRGISVSDSQFNRCIAGVTLFMS